MLKALALIAACIALVATGCEKTPPRNLVIKVFVWESGEINIGWDRLPPEGHASSGDGPAHETIDRVAYSGKNLLVGSPEDGLRQWLVQALARHPADRKRADFDLIVRTKITLEVEMVGEESSYVLREVQSGRIYEIGDILEPGEYQFEVIEADVIKSA